MTPNEDAIQEPSQKSLIQTLRNGWEGSNNIINYFLCALVILACCAFFFGISYWPAAIAGLFGLHMLYLNKKDGLVFIVVAGLLWTLVNAFATGHTSTTFRFFSETPFLVAWDPLILTSLTVTFLFVKKEGIAWTQKCKNLSTFSVILLTIVIVIWLWVVYFDYVTKFGLPNNLRYYIDRFLY